MSLNYIALAHSDQIQYGIRTFGSTDDQTRSKSGMTKMSTNGSKTSWTYSKPSESPYYGSSFSKHALQNFKWRKAGLTAQKIEKWCCQSFSIKPLHGLEGTYSSWPAKDLEIRQRNPDIWLSIHLRSDVQSRQVVSNDTSIKLSR